MYSRRYFNSINPFNPVITRHVRFFARDPFPNKFRHYLYRANLIDSIRLSLRSASPDSLTSLLSHRLLDSFIVKNALRSAPSVASAWSIINTLKRNPHFSHDVCTLHAFATVLAKHQRVLELKSLIGIVNAGKFGNIHFSCMNLMNWYATAGDFDSVLKTWDEYRVSEKEKRVCAESYNIVMQVYMKMGRDSQAVETFNRMIDEGGIPNSRTFTIMIEHLVNSRNLEAAMEIFKILPLMRITRTLKHYAVLVEGLVGEEKFDEVKTLLAEMKADGKFPSRRMLKPLKCMEKAGFTQETEEFLRGMSPDERIKDIYKYSLDDTDNDDGGGEGGDDDDAGGNNDDDNVVDDDDDMDKDEVKLKPWLDPKSVASALKNWNPDAVAALEEANLVWTNLLVCKVLRGFRSPETAWKFFCWVAYQPGFAHDTFTVERMMALLARHGHVELVDKLISKVRREGIKLPFSTIRLVIDLYGVSKKPDAAIKIFKYDRSLCSPISSFNLTLLYSSLLRTLTKCRRNAEALHTLDEMILNGLRPDIQTFSGLMYHFASQGEIQTVQKLFSMVRQIGLEPDPYMLKILVQAYCRCERAALAYRVFQDMRDSHFMLDRETKDLLVRSLWKEEKRKEAAAVEESYDDVNNVVLPLVLRGHVWSISSANISRICNIYVSSVLKTSN